MSDPRELDSAWSRQYAEVATNIARMLPKKAGVLVEVGSGEGQLTVPFADLVPRYKIIALDRFKGAYSGNEAGLLSTIVRNGLNARISVVVSDYNAWLTCQRGSKYDGVISSEFLPEITSKRMEHFFAQCHRAVEEWPSDSFEGREAASQRLGHKTILLETPQWDLRDGRVRNSGLDYCRRDQAALRLCPEACEFPTMRFLLFRGL